MGVNKGFTAVHNKAIQHHLSTHQGVRLVAPCAYPQVTFLLPDGTYETKEVIHLVSAYNQSKKQSKRGAAN